MKVSWSSKITPRFLTELDGVIVDEPNWMVKSCCRVGVAGKTRSSVFARLSCRWCSFIHAEMSTRQPEICAATAGSCVICIAMVGEPMCLYDGSQWCSVYGEEEGSKNWSLRNPGDQLMCEVESLWCPAMKGWIGESDDLQYQRWQIDPAEWELMVWNRLFQSAGLQWPTVMQTQLNGHFWNLTG